MCSNNSKSRQLNKRRQVSTISSDSRTSLQTDHLHEVSILRTGH